MRLDPILCKKTPLQLSNDLTFHRSCRWKVVDWNKLPMTICQQHPGKLREMAYFGAWEPSRGAGLLICTLPQHISAGFKPFASDTFGRLMVAGRDQMWRYPQNLLWSSLVYAPKHFSCSIFRWLNPANCAQLLSVVLQEPTESVECSWPELWRSLGPDDTCHLRPGFLEKNC